VSSQAASAQSAPETWESSTVGEEYLFAAVENSAGHVLGQYCFFESGSCSYLLAIGTNCEPESEYPALVSSDVGAAHLTLVCGAEIEGQHVLIVPFDDMDKIVRKSSRVGLVVPMQNDQFKVARFSLAGSSKAIERMLAAASERLTDDQLKNASNPPAEEHL